MSRRPRSWAEAHTRQPDPLTHGDQGLFDRCAATQTCPRLFHVATALEMWEGRQSLGLTDPLGLKDVADPPNVRTFIMASTQHGSAPLPLSQAAPFGNCQQQPNHNPQLWMMRALMSALTAWVTLDAAEFIRRFLLHVLPSGFHRIRHYGLFAGAVRAHNIERARQALAAPRTLARETTSRRGRQSRLKTPSPARRCPCCGGRMIIVETFEGARPARSPSPSRIRIDTS